MPDGIARLGAADDGVHGRRRLALHRRRDVAVEVEGDRDLRVAQHLRDDLRVNAAAEEQGRGLLFRRQHEQERIPRVQSLRTRPLTQASRPEHLGVGPLSERERCAVQVRGSLQPLKQGLTIVEPKTARSRRQIGLAEIAVAALRRHKANQAKERLRLGAASIRVKAPSSTTTASSGWDV